MGGLRGEASGWPRRIFESVGAFLLGLMILGLVVMRDDVRTGKAFDVIAGLIHTDFDNRLDLMETPERIIQFANAAKAVEEAEAAADRSRENASAIQIIKVNMSHQGRQLTSIEEGQAEILRRLTIAPPAPSSPPP